MTLDKFGRHVQKHIIKRHLEDKKILRNILKHPTVEEMVGMQIKKVAPTTVATTSPVTKFTITIYSDGSINMSNQFYRRCSTSKNNILYENRYYKGKVLSVNYSNHQLSELYIHGVRYDYSLGLTKPFTIQPVTYLYLKHIGPVPLAQTEAVYAELLIEGNVDY